MTHRRTVLTFRDVLNCSLTIVVIASELFFVLSPLSFFCSLCSINVAFLWDAPSCSLFLLYATRVFCFCDKFRQSIVRVVLDLAVAPVETLNGNSGGGPSAFFISID